MQVPAVYYAYFTDPTGNVSICTSVPLVSATPTMVASGLSLLVSFVCVGLPLRAFLSLFRGFQSFPATSTAS